jgi:hypothetical protein
MTTPGLAHYLDRALGHMKEACDIGGDAIMYRALSRRSWSGLR